MSKSTFNHSKRYAAWLRAKTAHAGSNASATKAGPGRHHVQGHQKLTAPRKQTAGIGEYVPMVQRSNPRRQAKLQLRQIASARQVRMQIKAQRREGARP